MRRRLVISTIAIVLVVLGALALPIGLIVYDAAEQQLDARLGQRASAIASSYEQDVANDREPSSTRYPVQSSPKSAIRYKPRAKYVLGRLGTTVASRLNTGPII